jgi:hypothetical protein
MPGMKRKRIHLRTGKLSVAIASLAVVCFTITTNISAAAKPSSVAEPEAVGAGRLIIVRAVNLGPTIVGLKIDGVQMTPIAYNRRYDAPIAAGSHVLTVYPVVSREGARPTEKRLNVEPGKTYTLTAKRADIEIVLQ